MRASEPLDRAPGWPGGAGQSALGCHGSGTQADARGLEMQVVRVTSTLNKGTNNLIYEYEPA